MSPSTTDRSDWRRTANAAALGQLIAQWLRGERDHCPIYPGGAPDPETREIAGALANINERGIITTGSQPGTDPQPDGYRGRAFVEGMATMDTMATLWRYLTGAPGRFGLYETNQQGATLLDANNDVRIEISPTRNGWWSPNTWESVDVGEISGKPVTTLDHLPTRRDVATTFGDVLNRATMRELTAMRQIRMYAFNWGAQPQLWEALADWRPE